MSKIKPALKKLLEKQHYAFIGDHSAIKICTWTKKSLRDEDCCYKEKFYGIKSHKCCQLSNTIGYCQNKCLICWRPTEQTKGSCMDFEVDEPSSLIPKAIEAQKKQLIGFKGNKKCNLKKFEEAMNPNQFAISLSGEPTLYPKQNEMIKLLKEKGNSVFVVSNGLKPEFIREMELPTQLYVSIDAPNKELFEKIDGSCVTNGWEKLNQTLEILKDLKCRTALRITLIKEMNMKEPENYAKLIEKSQADFVEVKSYMWIGHSQQRLEQKNMPIHEEVKEFAKKILEYLPNYEYKDEKIESRVVLLMKKGVEQFISPKPCLQNQD